MRGKNWQDPEKGAFGEQAFLQAFGQQVRVLRQERGLTQAELAEKAEVGMKYVGEIERSKTNPTVRLVWRLGEALGIDVFEFFLFPPTNRDEDARVRVQLLRLLKDRKGEDLEKVAQILRLLER
jgi:transcriptional regulator with XRE-family HTH domain